VAEFRLVPAKIWHCGAMIRKLREAQAGALASIGIRSHAELRARFAESSLKLSWEIDGKLSALGGVTGSLLSSTGFIWLALAEEATRYPRQTALTARVQLAEIMKTRHEVFSVMFPSDAASMRWIKFLKFEDAEQQPQWVPAGAVLMVHRKGQL
jgi:hypothetical protein